MTLGPVDANETKVQQMILSVSAPTTATDVVHCIVYVYTKLNR